MDLYDLMLAMTPRISNSTAKKLIEEFGSAEKIFNAPIEKLASINRLNINEANAIKNQVARQNAIAEIEHCQKYKIKIIAATDPEYPNLLREINDPPHVIYIIGNHEILNNPAVAIVGTRSHTTYGEKVTMKLINDLSNEIDNLVIVSGLAHGIDGVAHRAALAANTPTIAIIPCQLPQIRPAQHSVIAREIVKAGGAIISELPSSTTYNKALYLSRNRLIAATTSATIVIESDYKGGSLNTARTAHGYNRPVYAVPGRLTDNASSGCNNIIMQNIASICISANSIIDDLGWAKREQKQTSTNLAKGVTLELITEQHLEVIKALSESEPTHISAIEQNTQLPIAKINGTLIELELLEIVKAVPGAYYELLVPHATFK